MYIIAEQAWVFLKVLWKQKVNLQLFTVLEFYHMYQNSDAMNIK